MKKNANEGSYPHINAQNEMKEAKDKNSSAHNW